MLYFQHLLIEQTQSKAIFGSKIGILTRWKQIKKNKIVFQVCQHYFSKNECVISWICCLETIEVNFAVIHCCLEIFSINQVSWHYNPKGLSYKLQEAVLSKWSQACYSLCTTQSTVSVLQGFSSLRAWQSKRKQRVKNTKHEEVE